jgi:hypothetical protein
MASNEAVPSTITLDVARFTETADTPGMEARAFST